MTEQIKRFSENLKTRVNENRYRHSLGTMEEAAALAKIYGADEQKATLAGLLHDITKDLTKKEHLELIRESGKTEDPDEICCKGLLHAVTAPIVLEKELGISDPEILSAVRLHTRAKPNMTLLEKILYIADFTEPTRVYADADFYRRIAREDLDKTLFLSLRWGLDDRLRKGNYIYKVTLETYNHYIQNFDTKKYIEEYEEEHQKGSII